MDTIILIGMMGSGKTQVGKYLADNQKFKHLDTDQLIEEIQGTCIENIFEQYGEQYFRKVESELLTKLSFDKNTVISTGGGIVLSEDNVKLLRKKGKVIYLKASVNQLKKHLQSDGGARPVLKQFTIEDVLGKRWDLYEKAAHCIIDTDGMDIVEIAEAILTKP